MRVRSLRRTIESYKDTGLIEQRKLERTGSVCASKHEKPPTRKLFCVQGCEFNFHEPTPKNCPISLTIKSFSLCLSSAEFFKSHVNGVLLFHLLSLQIPVEVLTEEVHPKHCKRLFYYFLSKK
jgi:hypothetical protein